MSIKKVKINPVQDKEPGCFVELDNSQIVDGGANPFNEEAFRLVATDLMQSGKGYHSIVTDRPVYVRQMIIYNKTKDYYCYVSSGYVVDANTQATGQGNWSPTLCSFITTDMTSGVNSYPLGKDNEIDGFEASFNMFNWTPDKYTTEVKLPDSLINSDNYDETDEIIFIGKVTDFEESFY